MILDLEQKLVFGNQAIFLWNFTIRDQVVFDLWVGIKLLAWGCYT